MSTYTVTYQPGPDMGMTQWTGKTFEDLMMPNGSEPLLVWMMRTSAERGLYFRLETEGA